MFFVCRHSPCDNPFYYLLTSLLDRQLPHCCSGRGPDFYQVEALGESGEVEGGGGAAVVEGGEWAACEVAEGELGYGKVAGDCGAGVGWVGEDGYCVIV